MNGCGFVKFFDKMLACRLPRGKGFNIMWLNRSLRLLVPRLRVLRPFHRTPAEPPYGLTFPGNQTKAPYDYPPAETWWEPEKTKSDRRKSINILLDDGFAIKVFGGGWPDANAPCSVC